MKRLTAVLADDHPIFRSGLKSVLESIPDCTVVGEARTGTEAISMIATMLPQVAFIDLAMPEKDGYAVLEWAALHAPDTDCIIMTMYKDPEYLGRAANLGAQGYLVKDDAYANLSQCLKTLQEGDFYVSPGLGTPMPPDPIKSDLQSETAELNKLTKTQRKILNHIAEFKTSREIASTMGVSPKTIENHRMNISAALGLRGPKRLLKFAIQNMEQLKR